MTKVTRQRKSTIAAELAAQPTTPATGPATAEAKAPATAEQPVADKAAKPKAAARKKSDKPAAPAVPATPATPEAPKAKTKLVRDSFTMPKAEYELLAQLKQRGTGLHRHIKKSELLRAGLAALAALPDEAFLAALDRVPSLKTGRPKADQPEGADKA